MARLHPSQGHHARQIATNRLAAGVLVAVLGLSPAARADAPPTANFTRVWHHGRVTGDIGKIIAFYHDALGLGLTGDPAQVLVFRSNRAVNQFVASPETASFRAAYLPIPGASSDGALTLEAFEYRDMGKRRPPPALSDTGASNLVFEVGDLDRTLAAVKTANAGIVTPGGKPVAMKSGARAVMIRDPDGYPVELMQTPSAKAGDRITGSATQLIVTDLDASLAFYTAFLGAGVQASAPSPWHDDAAFAALRGLGKAPLRSASIMLPGSSVTLELIQLRGVTQAAWRPDYRDIGHAHIALYTPNVRKAFERTVSLGARPLSPTGSWTVFSPSLKGFYTRDPDGFFLEVIERD